MSSVIKELSLRQAAIVAGLATLIMTACAPFAELIAYPKLIVDGNGAETINKIRANQTLFAAMITGYLITFICDILAAWALYILLKPTNTFLSALAALFRIVFAMIAVISLLNLVNTFRVATDPEYTTIFTAGQMQAEIMFSSNAFRFGFHFGLLFFGIYLILLGYLVWVSKYIPRILGLLLIISGLGYSASSLQPFFFPNINMTIATYTFFGELIFMLWLLFRGWKLKEQQIK